MSGKKGGKWPSVIKSVEKVVELLPSDEEIKQNVMAIDSLISFLQQIRKVMTDQPTGETRQDVLKAITLLSSFLSSHTTSLLLANKTSMVRSRLKTEIDTTHLFEELNSLSLDEIQSKLLNPTLYTVNDLKVLAKHLRIGIDKNFRREDIADSIFKRGFANPRGYKAIGGVAAQKIQEEANEPKSHQ